MWTRVVGRFGHRDAVMQRMKKRGVVEEGGEPGQSRVLARALERQLGGFLGGVLVARPGCLRREDQAKKGPMKHGEGNHWARDTSGEQERCGAKASTNGFFFSAFPKLDLAQEASDNPAGLLCIRPAMPCPACLSCLKLTMTPPLFRCRGGKWCQDGPRPC